MQESDFITQLDNVKPRVPIDNRINGYCDSLLGFLKDSKMCICNGCITPEYDDFTCSNTRGQSVVDYIITPQNCIDKCTSCVVHTVSSLIESLNLHQLLSSSCKAPDHNLLVSSFLLNIDNDIENTNPKLGSTNQFHETGSKIYDFNKTDMKFMNNELWMNSLQEMIPYSNKI